MDVDSGLIFFDNLFAGTKNMPILAPSLKRQALIAYMVNVAQLVRALDCGSKGRGFEPHLSPREGSSYFSYWNDCFSFYELFLNR